MDFDQDGDQGFLLELERTAKSLSIGSDGSSVAELRRLLQQVETDLGRDSPDSPDTMGERDRK